MREKVAAVFTVFSCLLLARCATGPSLYKEVINDVTAETVTIHASRDASGNIEVVRLSRLEDPRDVTYLVRVSYGGPSWRFMAGPITLRTDQQEVELETETDGVHQVLQGRVPSAFVRELFTAGAVSIQYWGAPVRLTGIEIEALRKLAPQGE